MAVGLLMLSALLCTLWSLPYRSLEASLVGRVLSAITATAIHADRFEVSNPSGSWMWFQVTMECTSAVLLVPLAVVAAWLVCQRRVRIRLVVLGLVVGWAIVAGSSTLRLFLIGFNYHHFGLSSFWLTHDFVGTLVSVISTLIALLVQVRITSMDRGERLRFFGPDRSPLRG